MVQDIRRLGQKLSNWGRWGPDDERGTLNYVTPKKVQEATRLVRKGKIIRLGLNYDSDGPQEGHARRFNPIHTMFLDGGDSLLNESLLPGGMGFADDMVVMPLQCSTQWDALGHVFYDGKMYNDHSAGEVTSAGAKKNSIDRVCEGVISRGVLLDFPRYKGLQMLEPGYAIMPQDLDGCAAAEKVSIEGGDVLLVRTGWIQKLLVNKDKAAYRGAGRVPGLSYQCLEWVHQAQIAAVASDTRALEAVPSGLPDVTNPFHMVAIRDMGLLLGEIFNFEALAADCAQDGAYEFLFVGAPLPFTGAVGSPLNPLAVK
ncbi:MAG: cyclase family protein [Chloroflexi bacterium]|nr:cyclase family protein [Chloroflexota bacterium]